MFIYNLRSSHYLIFLNKQQETYAGMKTHYTQTRYSMDTIIPIGIYCYFDLRKIEKLRSFQVVKHKAQ